MPDTPPSPTELPRTDPRRLRRAGLVIGAALLVVLGAGTATRLAARQDLAAATRDNATPSVNVVRPAGGEAGALVLPGRLQAWAQAPVYARTDGYLRRWYADIGTPVKAGQVLAEIDAPEVDQQLAAANAALATAQAQRDLSAVTAARWERLVELNAVSRQAADERRGDLAAREAMRNEAQANVQRLRALTGFRRIVAPFDGVVTSRDVDVGALIAAGDGRATPLFTVADTRKLRLYVSVPQSLAAGIRPGLTARFTTPDQPDQVFEAQLVRSADAVDAQSGAMLVQLVFDNSAGRLKPGAYAQVTLDLQGPGAGAAPLRVPSSALLFRKEGTAVAVVGPGDRVQVRPVRIARDFGASLELAGGIGAADWVVNNPPDSIADGDLVRPVRPQNAAKAGAPARS
ncbi:efflux RND transporter periplasmic adaptor subunit [Caulobacter sp. LARHSG274]